MKNILKFVLILLSFVIVGCNEDKEFYEPETPEDSMHIKASSSSLTLQKELSDEVAVTFSWDASTNLASKTDVKYYFKMDIADNSFATSIPKIEMPAGTQSISYTHKALNELLYKWGVTPGDKVEIEVEIIADIIKSDVYIKPEVSKIRIEAMGYEVPPKDFYLVGSATEAGMDPSMAIKMTEIVPEKEYTWKGYLSVGEFKFIEDKENLLPSYNKGANNETLIYRQSEADPDNMFQVSKAGVYTIHVNKEKMSISYEFYILPYDNIWMVGDATPAGWNIMQSTPFVRNSANPELFVYEGPLSAGDMKFPLILQSDWAVPFLMPIEANANPANDNRMELVPVGGRDFKWHIAQSGNYKVTLNTNQMTITIEDAGGIVLPYLNIWMIGDAVPTGWSIDNATALVYDKTVDKKSFIWEGTLSAGVLKFPLSISQGYDCDFLMPKNVGSDNTAPLTESQVEMVTGGNPDKKWKVEESGTYKITLNVIDMTISFEKK